MRTVFLLVFALGGPLPAGVAPAPPHAGAAPLSVTDTERRYFELGDVLAKTAFAYASLTQQTRLVSRAGMSDAQLAQIGRLAPDARAARAEACGLLARSVALLRGLGAPAKVVSPLALLAAQFSRPLTPTGTSKQIAAFAPDAGTVLASLDESTRLSGLLDTRALQAWATGTDSSRTGRVWYAEGLMAGVADTASATGQMDLLPPPSELATDLRGLRDWLALRLPETPSPDQAALQAGIDTFLQQTSAKGGRPGRLTADQMQDLGGISRLLQAQILPGGSPAAVTVLQGAPRPPDGGETESDGGKADPADAPETPQRSGRA